MITTKIYVFQMYCLGDGFSGSEGVRGRILVRLPNMLDLLESTYLLISTQQQTNSMILHCTVHYWYIISYCDKTWMCMLLTGRHFLQAKGLVPLIYILKRITPRESSRAVSSVLIMVVKQEIGKLKNEPQTCLAGYVRIFISMSQNIEMLMVTHGSVATFLRKHVLVSGKVFGMTSIV